MSIVTCTAKTRNDLSVARIVIEVLAQSWGYKCSVTYNEGKSFDIMVPAGAEENAILKFKRLAPDLDIYKSDKKAMATAQTESRKRMKKESSWDKFPEQERKYGWDVGKNAEFHISDIGDFLYEPGDDEEFNIEETVALLVDPDSNDEKEFKKKGDHRDEAEKIGKMSYDDAVKYCKENWTDYYSNY